MNLSLLSLVPGNLAICFATLLLIAGGLVLYALYKKGDVRAEFSHGKTLLRLEAKERSSGRE